MVLKNWSGRMAQTCAQAQSWVKENYEINENGVVAKSVIYKNYEEYCKHNGRPIMETSIFGRVVKQVFPQVQIRRLGGRDNLKYYYCGIQAQLDSPYVNDNQNTIRPKRRQRKRPVVTDKAEAQNCLRWIYGNYMVDHDSSVDKNELYAHYVQDCHNWGSPLSPQDFLVVVTDGLTKLAKRKLSTKLQQQGFILGFKRRPQPIDPSLYTSEFLAPIESIISQNNRVELDFREGSNTPDDDFCASPESEEGSDNCYSTFKEESTIVSLPYDDEPVDYSLSSLKVKSEVIDSEPDIKEEKMSGDENSSSFRHCTPEGPLSRLMDSPTPSPSPPQRSTRPKPYKPRFHINYQQSNDWEIPSEIDSPLETDSAEQVWDALLKNWLEQSLERCRDWGVNRDEVYEMYERYCNLGNYEVLPVAHFDKVVFKMFPGTVTRIHNHGVTLYEGVRIGFRSGHKGSIQEINFREGLEEETWGETARPMDLSSPHSRMNDSLMTLGDEDFDEPNVMDQYREVLDDDDDSHSIPDILKDGKYYLKTWLQDNFESIPESCVLKADAYKFYEQFAHSLNQAPFEMNVFGKIVRQVFPKVSIRRLGGRQKPQYHYCGIAPKPSSQLFSVLGGKDPAQRSRKKEISTDSINTESALNWLENSFLYSKKGVIMKNEVYERYKCYCISVGIPPHNLNYFGKLVKHCFPEVEVRKCGGRAEPTWYYYGLQNKFQSGNDQFPDSPMTEFQSPHQAASQPISVPADISSANETPYMSSPRVIQLPFNSNSFNAGHDQFLSRSTQCFGSLNETLATDSYPRTPDLSRVFHENLSTQGQMDTSRMSVRSPDVAPDIFPKSPEGSAAQISRSPSMQYFLPPPPTDSSSTGAMMGNPPFYNQMGLTFSSPQTKRSAQLVPSPSHMDSLLLEHSSQHLLHKKLKHQVSSENTYPRSGRS